MASLASGILSGRLCLEATAVGDALPAPGPQPRGAILRLVRECTAHGHQLYAGLSALKLRTAYFTPLPRLEQWLQKGLDLAYGKTAEGLKVPMPQQKDDIRYVAYRRWTGYRPQDFRQYPRKQGTLGIRFLRRHGKINFPWIKLGRFKATAYYNPSTPHPPIAESRRRELESGFPTVECARQRGPHFLPRLIPCHRCAIRRSPPGK